ncbi:sugar kinase [Pseudonocardiaceae bacterium YIM PH 21723]|nr:sugar kinase [Pseudonocardiaceae bacterium YIM PH 21723]
MRSHDVGVLAVGAATVDLIHEVGDPPPIDGKIDARRQLVVAGGSAANGAVTAAYLGAKATLLTGLGQHMLTGGIHADLEQHGVQVMDLDPQRTVTPPVSAIRVTAGTGERAVVSWGAQAYDPGPDELPELRDLLHRLVFEHDVLLLDGQHPRLALAAAQEARRLGRLSVLDADHWTPGLAELIPLCAVVVASHELRPPGCADARQALRYVARHCSWAAMTHGAGDVRWQAGGQRGTIEVPQVTAIDTLAAGDIFHGALAATLAGAPAPLTVSAFTHGLRVAARTASASCTVFGPRAWMRTDSTPSPLTLATRHGGAA